LRGYGTAVVDGVLAPGEWDAAGRLDFQANRSPADGGGTVPATLFVMNDGTKHFTTSGFIDFVGPDDHVKSLRFTEDRYWLRARLEMIQARVDARVARVRLEHAVGRDALPR